MCVCIHTHAKTANVLRHGSAKIMFAHTCTHACMHTYISHTYYAYKYSYKPEMLTMQRCSLGDGISLLQVVLTLVDSEDCAAHLPDAVVLKDDSGDMVTGVDPANDMAFGNLEKRNTREGRKNNRNVDNAEASSRSEHGKVAEHKDKRMQHTWASFWASRAMAARTWASLVLSQALTMMQSVCLFLPAVVAVLVASEVSDTRTCLQWQETKHKSSTHKVLRYTKEFPLHKIK
jgi:hypothetical protein